LWLLGLFCLELVSFDDDDDDKLLATATMLIMKTPTNNSDGKQWEHLLAICRWFAFAKVRCKIDKPNPWTLTGTAYCCMILC
jgi:hypothetical protein